MSKILIKNGFIIENNQLVVKDVLISGQKIKKIASSIIDHNSTILDAAGSLIIPGAVDVHVHFREPGFTDKETIKTGSLAAAKGGVTTVCAMPNLKPHPDNLTSLNQELKIIKKDAIIDVFPYATITLNQEEHALADLKKLATKTKLISNDGHGINDLKLLKSAMQLAKKYDLIIASHAEDKNYGTLPMGEYTAVKREIELAKQVGVKYHFCHLSTKESFDALREAHRLGFNNITCEVSPHHLLLDETMIDGTNFKMNPPLRSKTDVSETVKALLDGTASIIASDHAPHTEAEKNLSYSQAPNGIIGLETIIPLIYTNFIKNNKASLKQFLDWIVYNPIKTFNLPKHDLTINSMANIAVIDIENKRKYTKEEILSKGKNSPFIGTELYGFIKYTLFKGKVVYQND